MRKDKYREWMGTITKQNGDDYKESTIDTHIRDLDRIEREEKVNLDKEFNANKLERLLNKYAYDIKDERAGRKNPTALDTKTTSLYGFLSPYRTQLRSYCKFCEKHPPK